MNKPVLCFFILTSVLPLPVTAEEHSLQDQIEEVKIMIEREQIVNIELKAELAARETEVDELKTKLKSLEDSIEALKQEHNLS